MNPYVILGIANTATQEEIKKAYRRAAAHAHPDREGGSNERMKEVNIAYEMLTNPKFSAQVSNYGNMNADEAKVHFATVAEVVEQFLKQPYSGDPNDPKMRAAVALLRILQIVGRPI